MKIIIQPNILNELKEALKKEEKTAVRFVLVDCGSSSAEFDVELDNQYDDDIFTQLDEVKFVAESKFAPALKTLEVIKVGNKFTVKKAGCSCSCRCNK